MSHSNYTIKSMLIISLFISFYSIAAYIKIPTPFLPMTLQYLFVLFAIHLLPIKLSRLSIFLYTLMGIIGFPIFSNGSGPSYFLFPSFGFIIGFNLLAFIAPFFVKRIKKTTFLKLFFLNIILTCILYLIGLTYMHLIFYYVMDISTTPLVLISTYMIPYIPNDLIACFISVLLAQKLKRLNLL